MNSIALRTAGRRAAGPSGWQAALRAAALGVLVLASPLGAAGAEDDGRLWATFSLQSALIGPLSGGLLVEPRFRDDIGDLERVVIQPSASLRIAPGVALGLGYDAHLIESPRDTTEHRVWQQLGAELPLRRGTTHHRVRLEQRFLEDVSGTAVRLRYRFRAAYPFGGGGVDGVLSNELFFDLNSPRGGPDSGFGENRAFAGLRFRIGPAVAFETGYQLQYVDRPVRDQANHTLMLGLSVVRR